VEGPTPIDDLETLEAHLDGALTPPEAEVLGRRLAADPALAEALERLRSQRDLRRAAWASYEPDESAAKSAAASVLAAAVREERWRRAVSNARRATAAAAVVLLAFAAGWAARGSLSPGARPPATLHAVDGADPHPFATSGGGSGNESFPVALTDEHGNIIAVQHFDDPARAREFAEDVGRWQSHTPRPATAPSVPPSSLTPVSDEF
jgi:hypothetical protein